jgi:adenosylcobinamide kinase/adenosylcobinamide-phosphate guanylyltransferase
MSRIIMVTGGARSGKSSFVQKIAGTFSEKVLFVATATAGDNEMQYRIAEHRKQRPAGWTTLEAVADIGTRISQHIAGNQVVIIDCITLLLNNIFGHGSFKYSLEDVLKLEAAAKQEVDGLLKCVTGLDVTSFIVTNEVGFGIVPDNPMARYYRDILGKANQSIALAADEVFLMVAGLPVRIKPSTPETRI